MPPKLHLTSIHGFTIFLIEFLMKKGRKNFHGKNHTKITKPEQMSLINQTKYQKIIKNLKNMKAGDLKSFILIIIFIFKINPLYSEEKINLNILQPTYEEESESEDVNIGETVKIKSKKKQSNPTGESIVKFRALDKITAKTKDINIVIGKQNRLKHGFLNAKHLVLKNLIVQKYQIKVQLILNHFVQFPSKQVLRCKKLFHLPKA